MSMAKVAVSIDNKQLKKIDYYVKKKVFKNRSQAFQLSINQTLQHLEHSRLAQECEKLDAHFEQEMAEIGLDEDLEVWPKY
jgi:metal-responsive CopG/Arc/MetJ family transcriptional regulator